MTDQADRVIRAEGQHRAIRLERVYDAAPAEVWTAITTSGQIERWLAEVRAGVIEPGETFELEMCDEPLEIAHCRVRTWQPERVLELDWDYPGELASRLRLELIPDEAGTRLVLDHAGVESGSDYAAGWHAHLDLLGALVENRELPSWQERFDALLPAYQQEENAIVA